MTPPALLRCCFPRYALALMAGCLFLFLGQTGAFAQLTRVPNTTLQMPSSPPTFGYTSVNAFPSLTFVNPVCIVSPPGETNRLFVVQKPGVIMVITNLAAPTKTVFMDISSRVISTDSNSGGTGEQGLLGLAFHPGYATNRQFFVFYTGDTTTPAGSGRHDILSRFLISPANTNQGLPTSEVKFIAQRDQQPNHNAGDIHFGPDGYLYVPLGDEGGGDDSENNSQRINKDFFSGLLRIDVDKKPGSLTPNPHASVVPPVNYAVPPDNPFIGATSFNGIAVPPPTVRTEFWAVGLRNPWRMTFDSVNGNLYVADVGQSEREEVSLITKGANYGWKYYEGNLLRSSPPAGMVHTPPLLDYAHNSGRVCIIGGVVYRGDRLSQLYGAYLYAEYATGEIWAMRHSGNQVTQNTRIIVDNNPVARIVTFGTDPSNGDVLYAAHNTSGYATTAIIKRITYNSVTNGSPLPPTLADTGAFANTATLTPNPGIVPYDINVPFWSDNAIKSRWFSVPNLNLSIGFDTNGNWTFPSGTVWVKHFELEMTNGVPSSRKRIETRLLVKNSSGVYGVVYRWGDSLTNATLLDEAGMDEEFVIDEGGGILRTQIWHYPSRTECLTCHTPEGGFGLGVNTAQLNKDYNYSGTVTNEILALSHAGYFDNDVDSTAGLPALANAANTDASLEHRVRSYLAANCVQCHQPGGSAFEATWDARFATPTALAGLIDGPLADDFGDPNNRVVKPLSVSNSMLHTRISVRGSGTRQMPPLASNLIDTQNVALVAEWIESLTNQFWLGATPDAQTVAAGDTADFALTALATDDFSNDVEVAVAGLPYGTFASLTPPTVSISHTSMVKITTSISTPEGAYLLTLNGEEAGVSNSAAITLVVAQPASEYAFEAEDLNFTPVGASAAVQFDASSSNGKWEALQADGVGDYIEYVLPNIPAGTYQLKLLYKSHPNRGIALHSLDGSPIGGSLDQYSNPAAYPEVVLGSRTFNTKGDHVLRQTVTGRNTSAGTYWMSADRFTLVRLAAPPPTSPQINTVSLSGNDLTVQGTNGLSGGVYYLLGTTNLNIPVTDWTVIQTNVFDGTGSFSMTNTIDAGAQHSFFLLKVP